MCVAYKWSPVFYRKLFFSLLSLNFWSIRRRPDLDYLLILLPLMLLGTSEFMADKRDAI